uniref:Uncharacterized protein n=2 Tax=Oryza sativa subsp. japonica TaxID=39947 RepID=Q7G202_ORYSJ|nr:hypothetical protein [Oryza sativa Japonica Group]AAP54739.1 transposon protein, putative, unclassified [Oryza sativa Japonica Group]
MKGRFKVARVSPGCKEFISGAGWDGGAPREAGDERRLPGTGGNGDKAMPGGGGNWGFVYARSGRLPSYVRAKRGRGRVRRENGERHYRVETGAVMGDRRRGSELSGLGPGKGKMTARGVLFLRPSHASVFLELRRRTARATAGQGRQWRGSVESEAGGVERRGSAAWSVTVEEVEHASPVEPEQEAASKVGERKRLDGRRITCSASTSGGASTSGRCADVNLVPGTLVSNWYLGIKSWYLSTKRGTPRERANESISVSLEAERCHRRPPRPLLARGKTTALQHVAVAPLVDALRRPLSRSRSPTSPAASRTGSTGHTPN